MVVVPVYGSPSYRVSENIFYVPMANFTFRRNHFTLLFLTLGGIGLNLKVRILSKAHTAGFF